MQKKRKSEGSINGTGVQEDKSRQGDRYLDLELSWTGMMRNELLLSSVRGRIEKERKLADAQTTNLAACLFIQSAFN